MAVWDTYSIFEGKDTCRARLCDTTIGNSWYWHSWVSQSEGCTGPKHHWDQHQHLFHVSLHCWWLVSPHWISSDCLSESAVFISNQWSESHSFLQFQISQSDDQCTAALTTFTVHFQILCFPSYNTQQQIFHETIIRTYFCEDMINVVALQQKCFIDDD